MRSNITPEELSDVPGSELILPGLHDLRAGVESIGSLLIEMAVSRLSMAGLEIPPFEKNTVEPELRLYELLGSVYGDEAYSQYSAYLQRLSKFESALDRKATLRWSQEDSSTPAA